MPNPLNEPPFTENYPQPVDIASFQKELTRIFGKHEGTGRPWVRVIWMASGINQVDEYGWPIAYDWDMYGNGGKGEWRRRYLYASSCDRLDLLDPATGLWYAKKIWTDISPPRFAIERFIHPEEALRGWVASGIDSLGDKWTDRRPTYGRYEPLMFPPNLLPLVPHIATGVISAHNDYCCLQASKEQMLCYGQYAEPSRVHLDEFQRLRYMQLQAKEDRPGEMTRDQFAAAQERSKKRDSRVFSKTESNIDLIVKEAWKTHRGLLSEDPSQNTHGVWHWMSGHNKAGTPTKPKIELTDK